ncbi:protein translocase subunit SecD [Parasphingopyxis lamellibrachiae]|uniref:Protein translocase subunit SecD n=1 Tax=Parasphingopyxis lamellibrachiae TaxID=680125 RepID=A0A3D9FIC6_9SPHN|nr:protein translocase subunit SecD [Parasphingopyxis lamellibrachiae]RED17553.1 preprotein translocase subunit SecD [Parasphingopyxis lamellibrachiae]
MNDFPPWKVWMLTAMLVIGVLLSIPSLLTEEQRAYIPEFLPQPSINLGLDLSGGVHILLEAQTEEFQEQRLQTLSDRIEDAMEDDGPTIEIGSLSRRGGAVTFTVRDEAQLDDAMERVRALTQPVGFTGQRDFSVENEDSLQIVVTPTEAGNAEAIDIAVNTATEVVRTRIDELGTREPTIIRQGTERIVVQVPGLDSPESLMALLGRTASLEFRLVNYEADPNMALACQAPIGSEAMPYANPADGTGCVIVQRRVMVSGDQLVNAQQGFDQRTGQVTVNLTFDGTGGREFGRVTQENVGRPFAILLDGEVLSAPNINEPILGGNAQISGSFSVQSANELAIALRSGRLPIELAVIENRTVGPELGGDSIRWGGLAGMIATIAVMTFMIVTYGRFGIYANVALGLNLFLILAIMALLDATLTLPGIAGFVLTVGAAVDANVLINERIREEQRRGRKVIDAVQTGYKEASRAIFDANITNFIGGVLMFSFGSGPVRGFAVVLVLGIVTSVFTAVTVTRMMVSVWIKNKRPTELNI